MGKTCVTHMQLWLLALGFLLFAPDPAHGALSVPSAGKRPSMTTEEMEKKVFTLVNRERRARGMALLARDEKLTVIARDHSSDMAGQGYFSHEGRTGETPSDRLRKKGISYRRSAENINLHPLVKKTTYRGGKRTIIYYSADELAASIVKSWMESEGHRANILTRQLERSGLGIAEGMRDGIPYFYVTQVFITPAR